MKTKDIVRMVCNRTGRTHKDVEPIVKATEEALMEAVMKYGEEVVMIGGRFYRKTVKASRRTNPRTHQKFWAPAKYVLCYYSTRRNRVVVPGQPLDEEGHLIVEEGEE